ncbi:tRNA 2-selenouridine(34) synthase MnmH [Undibacterium crateris]|uniref:tRNA 2-selenouridine(34) synthase MnmH n=1 Tax=Undibacterium crateris TaxID=2528175 RepID=UPI001389B4FD|nr:tRNA 2-selenouridine(34) synthase MnmH [Undibacterium crateris]NDI86622.1 tRNA 2-selenouridine(34) synthase MnmH [Undibacterium crateris]
MKYPELIQFTDIATDLSQFDCIIDARSESEFAEDHLPGAINCPVLNNEQRIQVGTMYKQVGSFEAKRLGAALVAANIAYYLQTLFQDKPREWRPLIYCWRGGNRSGSMAHIFSKVGWPVAQLQGGYKAYRQHVNEHLPTLAQRMQWHVICGTTGSGKSRMLTALSKEGAQVLDLEQLACHKGSVLGLTPGTQQPSQKQFESHIWSALTQFDPSKPVYVEAESKKVGNLRVPEQLMEAMRAAPCTTLELDMPHRVSLLKEEYAHFQSQPELLIEQLSYLSQLHGNDKINAWKQMIRSEQLDALVLSLLREHYDPAYLKSINNNFKQFSAAQTVRLQDLTPAAMTQTAREILNPAQPSTSSTMR